MNKKEKRLYKRKKVVIPAMIYESSADDNIGRYFSTTIFDISASGICIAFSLEKSDKIKLVKNKSNYEIIFHLNNNGTLYRIMCKPVYIMRNSYVVKVGGFFIESDGVNHKQLGRQLKLNN